MGLSRLMLKGMGLTEEQVTPIVEAHFEMTLSEEMLKGMGLTKEQISSILEAHSETITGLKKERDGYKMELERVKRALESANETKKELETLKSGDWEAKYNEEHESFERYKKDVETKAKVAKTKELYVKLLKDTGVGEQFIDSIIGVTDLAGMTISENGDLENKDNLVNDAKERWSGFIVQDKVKGAEVQTPPDSGIDMTKEAFFKLPLNEQMGFANSHPAEAKEFFK